MDKLSEELEELKAAAAQGTNVEEELGDLLFSAVNVSRFVKADPEQALNAATDKFISRFRKVEALARPGRAKHGRHDAGRAGQAVGACQTYLKAATL